MAHEVSDGAFLRGDALLRGLLRAAAVRHRAVHTGGEPDGNHGERADDGGLPAKQLLLRRLPDGGKHRGIKTNVTLIFSANQAILAANAGATYVSPFLGRLDDISQPGIELIRQISEIFDIYGYDTEIIAASIRNPIHVTDCALAGADIATIPYKVIEQMTKHPLTDQGIEKFQADYRAVFGD